MNQGLMLADQVNEPQTSIEERLGEVSPMEFDLIPMASNETSTITITITEGSNTTTITETTTINQTEFSEVTTTTTTPTVQISNITVNEFVTVTETISSILILFTIVTLLSITIFRSLLKRADPK